MFTIGYAGTRKFGMTNNDIVMPRYRSEVREDFAGIVIIFRSGGPIDNPKAQMLRVKVPVASKISGLLPLLNAKI
jgi:hypothetical protein